MMPADPNVRLNSITLRKVGAALGWIACWAWAIFVVSGGIGLLIIRGAMAADTRLVRPAFGPCRLSTDGDVAEKIRRDQGFTLGSGCRCRSFHRRRQDCAKGRTLMQWPRRGDSTARLFSTYR
jgi:hypothetical protein